jgi:ceramide glucosyltransferase
MPLKPLGVAAFVAACAGLGYWIAALRELGRLRIKREAGLPVWDGDDGHERAWPSVSILKPLAGREPNLPENLGSFCRQDYPDYEVIFGIADADDPAADVARQVMREHPSCRSRLIIGDCSAAATFKAANRKVANLCAMQPEARGDLIVVADSDTRVDSGYLRWIAAAFSPRSVGAVTCVYRGAPATAGLWATLGALFINDQFMPSVLVAARLGPLDFCLGATMAVRRQTLHEIGGFAALADHLADDRMLGRLVYERGYGIALSPYVVEHDVAEASLTDLWHHEVRWHRTILSARPLGYAFSFVTYVVPLAGIAAACLRNAAGWSLLGVAVMMRLALHQTAHRALDGSRVYPLWLLPLRDFLSFGEWAAGFLANRVGWRGRRLSIDKSGKITRET